MLSSSSDVPLFCPVTLTYWLSVSSCDDLQALARRAQHPRQQRNRLILRQPQGRGKRPKRLLRGRKIPQRQQKRQDKPDRAAQG